MSFQSASFGSVACGPPPECTAACFNVDALPIKAGFAFDSDHSHLTSAGFRCLGHTRYAAHYDDDDYNYWCNAVCPAVAKSFACRTFRGKQPFLRLESAATETCC